MIDVHRPDSTAVSAFAYDQDSRELYIRYRGGAAYTYFDVPLSTYLDMQAAESIGAFVNMVVKPNYAVRGGAPI